MSSTQKGPPSWPSALPPVDGVILSFDPSKRNTYEPIEGLLSKKFYFELQPIETHFSEGYRDMSLPVVVLGCNTDPDNEAEVNTTDARDLLKKYDTGLIQVSIADPSLKDKMMKSFNYILAAVVLKRGVLLLILRNSLLKFCQLHPVLF